LRALVQRVTRAQVTVDGEVVGSIRTGLLIYLGVAPLDTAEVADHLAQRLVRMRIFSDAQGKMNHGLLDRNGSALVVSQFTLFADNRRGHRPAFTDAGPAELARDLCRVFVAQLRLLGVADVQEGQFGSHMAVESVNDGPVTIVATSAEVPWSADCG
jgi:D-tyrosyl-tRNA(Tyr) deacylase